jgi:hypothetical protein
MIAIGVRGKARIFRGGRAARLFVMKSPTRVWVYLAILIAAAGVVIHIGALFAGESWFVFFNAPPGVVASARAGTWLAPASGLVIAGLMGLCGYYAASSIGLTPRPPLQRPALAGMATVCIVRALLLPVLAISHPELRNTFEIVAAIVWGIAGVGLAMAFHLARPVRAGGGNLKQFKEIIAVCGWPKNAKDSHGAWLLAQHADSDPAFQRQAKDLLEASVKTAPRNTARSSC